jgi:hypothetical protein
MPSGYSTLPQINAIPLTATFTNQGGSLPVSGTIAQIATFNVYFAHKSGPGLIDFLIRVLVPGTDAQPTVVSISYS